MPVIEELSNTTVPVKSDLVLTSSLYVLAPDVLFQLKVGEVETPIAPFTAVTSVDWPVVKPKRIARIAGVARVAKRCYFPVSI